MSEKIRQNDSRVVIAREGGIFSRSRGIDSRFPASLLFPFFFLLFISIWLCGCDVHEWPGAGDSRLYRFRLEFDTAMTRLESPYLSKSGRSAPPIKSVTCFESSRWGQTARYPGNPR